MLFLKEHHLTALHVACGDITDVALDGQNLVIRTHDSMLADMLADGRREVENALRWQGLDIGLKVEVIQKEVSKEEKDIARLQNFFGDYLIVK